MSAPAQRLRFGLFEVDLQSGELFRQGAKLKLQNPANTMLGPIRELRQIEIDES